MKNKIAFALTGFMFAASLAFLAHASSPVGDCPEIFRGPIAIGDLQDQFTPDLGPIADKIDEGRGGNGDGFVCFKRTPGEGNTGEGLVITDNRI